jgi:hypothetical protein
MPAMTSNPLTQTSAQGRGVTRHSARTLNVSFSQALVSVADRVETVEVGLPDCCERQELEVSLRPSAVIKPDRLRDRSRLMAVIRCASSSVAIGRYRTLGFRRSQDRSEQDGSFGLARRDGL